MAGEASNTSGSLPDPIPEVADEGPGGTDLGPTPDPEETGEPAGSGTLPETGRSDRVDQ